MKNTISRVASSILVMGMMVSGVNAASLLVTDGNTTSDHYKEDQSSTFAVDLTAASSEANLTFIPNINGSAGSGFTLKFENGGYLESQASIFLCANGEANNSKVADTVVGNMFSRGQSGTIIDNVMTAPQFQFKNDVNESLIQNGSHIVFRTNDQCTEIPKIIGINGSCQTVTAQIVDGVTTQGTAYPDYDTDKRILGKTKKVIKVACSVPVCKIDATADMKKFTTNVVPAGINKIVDATSDLNIVDNADNMGLISECPGCDQVALKCTTKIQIANEDGIPIQAMKFALNFYNQDGQVDNAALKLSSTVIELDGNKTVDYKIDGSTVELSNLDLNSSDGNTTITVTYEPDETNVIPSGLVKGRIFDLDTNTSKSGIDVNFDEVKNFALFKVAGLTKFVVPYMNTDYKTFVKITSLSDTSSTKLSAVITDQDGKSTDVTLNDIPAKGTVYLFSTFGQLYDQAQAAGLKNAWTVEFTATTAVTVDAYMKSPNGGDRRIEAFGN
jgi:hypothetical protein